MDKDWMIDLAAAIRDGDVNAVKEGTRKIVAPRKARSWYDVYKLMRLGFIIITELGDDRIELRDWGDNSSNPFVLVAPRDAIINMIYANRFPSGEEYDMGNNNPEDGP